MERKPGTAAECQEIGYVWEDTLFTATPERAAERAPERAHPLKE